MICLATLKDGLTGLKGKLEIIRKDPDGSTVTVDVGENVITNRGKRVSIRRLAKDFIPNINYMGIGDGKAGKTDVHLKTDDYISNRISSELISSVDIDDSPASGVGLATFTASFHSADYNYEKVDYIIYGFATFSVSAPGSPSVDDLWIDTDDNYKLYKYNGSSWDQEIYPTGTIVGQLSDVDGTLTRFSKDLSVNVTTEDIVPNDTDTVWDSSDEIKYVWNDAGGTWDVDATSDDKELTEVGLYFRGTLDGNSESDDYLMAAKSFDPQPFSPSVEITFKYSIYFI